MQPNHLAGSTEAQASTAEATEEERQGQTSL